MSRILEALKQIENRSPVDTSPCPAPPATVEPIAVEPPAVQPPGSPPPAAEPSTAVNAPTESDEKPTSAAPIPAAAPIVDLDEAAAEITLTDDAVAEPLPRTVDPRYQKLAEDLLQQVEACSAQTLLIARVDREFSDHASLRPFYVELALQSQKKILVIHCRPTDEPFQRQLPGSRAVRSSQIVLAGTPGGVIIEPTRTENLDVITIDRGMANVGSHGLQIADPAAERPDRRKTTNISRTGINSLRFTEEEASLSAGEFLRPIVEPMRSRYDLIVLDAVDRAPWSVADLTALNDLTCLVVRLGQTGRRSLKTVQRAIQRRGARTVGLIAVESSDFD